MHVLQSETMLRAPSKTCGRDADRKRTRRAEAILCRKSPPHHTGIARARVAKYSQGYGTDGGCTCGTHAINDVAREAEGHQLGCVEEAALLKRHAKVDVHHLRGRTLTSST